MENAKCKRREVAKNKNYARKGGRKPQKRTKKMKGKQNLQPLMRTKHKFDQRGVDGMFFRGLTSRGINKGTSREAKEAWKNEDINKIIHIGKVYFQKENLAVPTRRRGKGISGCRDSRKFGKSCFAFGESPTDSSQDFDCSLSPISPPLTPKQLARIKERSADELPAGRRKLNTEEELHTFSIKYEAAVAARILSKLPENGVLEDALTALRKLQKRNRHEDPEREEPFWGGQVEFLRDDLEAEDYVLGGKFLVPEEQFCESFAKSPLENMFIMNAPLVGVGDHPPYTSVFDGVSLLDGNEDESAVVEPQTKDFQEPAKELTIATPPIQFYRRNMF